MYFIGIKKMSKLIQKNNLFNIIQFGFKSPQNLKILIDKLIERFFDKKGNLSKEENLKWIKNNCSDYTEVFKNIDNKMWEESLNYGSKFKLKAENLLSKIDYNLGGGGIYPILYFLTKLQKPKFIVETGVAAGFSSQMFLKAIAENRQGTLYSSDLVYFRLKNPQRYVGILIEDELKKNWKLFMEGDKINIPKIKKEISQIDIFHYDSDKSYSGRVFALNQLESLFTADTVIIFDDIQDNSHFHDYVQEKKLGKYYIFEFENKYIGVIANLSKLRNHL